jgi:hypothetical protein
LAQPSHPDIEDPMDGTVTHPAEAAGATLLMNALWREYGVHEQDMSISSLEAFFTHTRGNLPMNDYLIMWKLTFDEAHQMAGLEINDIGKSFLLLHNTGLSQRDQRDFKLQIGGDLRRFEELTAVITRFASHSDVAASSTLQRMSQQYYEDYDDGEYEDYWQDSSWDDYDWQDYDDWQEDYYTE